MQFLVKIKNIIIIPSVLTFWFFVKNNIWFAVAAIILFVLFLLIPKVGEILHSTLEKSIQFIVEFIGKIVLSVLYFSFVTPISIINRLMSKQNGNNVSAYSVPAKQHSHDDFQKMW